MRDAKSQLTEKLIFAGLLVMGGVLGFGIAIANSWTSYGVIMATCFGMWAGAAIGGLAKMNIPEQKLQPPIQEAAQTYWRAFADANRGLGEPSLQADGYVTDLKRTQMTSRHGKDFSGVFTNEHARSSWEAYPTGSRFQAGQPAQAYWAKVDRARLEALESRPIDNAPPKLWCDEDRPSTRLPNSPLHLTLIQETQIVRDMIESQAKQHSDSFGGTLANMVKSVDLVIAELKRNPINLFDVQRLFTYYLPEVGRLLSARERMLTIQQTASVTEIDTVLDRIETAFSQFAQRMHQADMRALDIDLKLLDQALATEFETPIGT